MFSITFIGAILGTLGFGTGLIVFHINIGRFYGQTLAEWVQKTRLKDDDISAEHLMATRKQLEVLAHDLLKHRLLGLDTLTREMRLYYKENNPKKLTPEQLDDMRDEFFRLCGVLKPSDTRLWTKLKESFYEIINTAGKTTSLPHFDPLFMPILRSMTKLRQILWLYVDNDKNSDVTQNLSKLDLSDCAQCYPTILKLADACRMVIVPSDIVQTAIDNLALQTKRGNIKDQIHIYQNVSQKLLCQAPPKILTMCLTRLMDNALEQGKEIGLDVSYSTDDFTGESYLLFKIYDTSDHLPQTSEYGVGMRGVKQSLTKFDSAIQFKQESRDNFKKAAIIPIPAADYIETPVIKRTWRSLLLIGGIYVFILSGFLVCLFYVFGGPPVEFAGQGSPIVEFSVNVGETLDIPLCNGGRNVRAVVTDANHACTSSACSFSHILENLQPCAQDISDPKCPGAIQWTPVFEDGQRQGKNYELTVHCIAEGPPSSEAIQRIRILVSRPNSTPALKLIQLINETKGEVHYLNPSQKSIKVDVTDKLQLRVLATDADADALTYHLIKPDGQTMASSDGSFRLTPEWSIFGTSTYKLSVTDNTTKTDPIPIILEADHLHPIEIRNISTWTNDNPSQRPCEGNSESMICRIPAQQSSEMTMGLWFDPLQTSVSPIIEFNATDTFSLDVLSIHQTTESQIGDLWELYTRPSNTLVGFIELTNIESTQEPGLKNYTFNITTTPALPPSANLALNVQVSERSRRLPELRSLLILVHQSRSNAMFSFSTKTIELTEFDKEEDASGGTSSVWIYSRQSTHSLTPPVIQDIVCQTPEFSQYFEKPTIHSVQNAWRMDFRLKRGCMPGLKEALTSKQRLCAASVVFNAQNTPSQDEVIWIMLNDRPCTPIIEALTLASDNEERNNNLFKWHFKIIDMDEDLDNSDIQLIGAQDYHIDLDPIQNPIEHTGTLTVQSNCNISKNSRMILQVQDKSKHTIQKSLVLPLNCPPLVSTPNNQTVFHVSEGDNLTIPLKHESDVTLSLKSPFGQILNDQFVWEASCRYGKGPHFIRIDTDAPNRMGNPLQLELTIHHCQPRFTLSLDNQMITTETPLTLNVGQTHHLKIHSASGTQALKFLPQTQTMIPIIQISENNTENDYDIEIVCTQAGTDELMIQVIPENDDNYLPIAPIIIPIECI